MTSGKRKAVARMEPTGPAFGRPDDKIRVMRDRPIPDCGAIARRRRALTPLWRLHPGYAPDQVIE
jgi:hypothetical protein